MLISPLLPSATKGAPMRLRVRARKGFTLLEMLAALLLAALLMLTVIRLVRVLHVQQTRTTDGILETESWPEAVFRRMETDLRNSRELRVERDGFRLKGFAGTHFPQFSTGLFPAVVRYRTRKVNGRWRLEREEQDSSVLTNTSLRSDLVAVDVPSVSLWFADVPDVQWSSGASGAGQWARVPKSIILQLLVIVDPETDPAVRQSDDEKIIRLRRTVFTRAGATR